MTIKEGYSRTTQKGEGDSVEDAITIQAKYDLNGNKRFETDGKDTP